MTDERPEDQPTGPGADPGSDGPDAPDARDAPEATDADAPGPDDIASGEDLPSAEAALASVEEAAESVQAAVDESAAGDAGGGDAGGGGGETGGGDEGTDSVTLAEFGAPAELSGDETSGLEMLGDVSLRVRIELGRTLMYVEDVLRLNTDSVIELDKAAGDPVDIFVNDRHVARGEVLVLNESFCVRVSEIIAAGGEES